MIREYVEISGSGSLDAIIARLEAVKAELPPGCSEAEVRLRGDDVFGRHILITYRRLETAAEIEANRRAQTFARSWLSAPYAEGEGRFRAAM
ncbi:MAG: hypothetical protein M3Q08_13555 [Pseudomonadota bacterium]|nr:hypothetical protein [Pseudomonadota bacterium]